MNIGIFGGSFNPVHNGHIKLLEKARENFSFDKIIVIPTNIPPHKKLVDFTSDSDRLQMCRLAFEGDSGIIVSDYEIIKDDVSYSVETLRYLKKKYPNDKLFFIMGSDMLLTFEKWRCYEEILGLTSIIAAARENEENMKMLDKARELEALGGEVHILEIEPYIISSSKIRALVKSGKDFSCYLPQRVVKYIMDNKLYLE